MRKSVVEKLADMKRKHTKPTEMTLEDIFLLLLDGDRARDQRQANPTQRAMAFDPIIVGANGRPDTKLNFKYYGYMGPKGCAKTSTICSVGMMRSMFTPGSKGFVGRADYNDLKGTTRLRLAQMLGRLPRGTLLDRSKDPPEKWIIQSVPVLSPEGDIINDDPSEITFIGFNSLDEGGSYEFDWGVADEATEISRDSMTAAGGWMRNMPRGWTPESAEGRYRIYLAYNPPDNFHWLYTAHTGLNFEGRRVEIPWIKLFLPTPRENQRNLPLGYYEEMARSMTEDQRIRLVEGRYGCLFEGSPVVPQFKYDVHARDIADRYDPYSPLYRFWDFGFRHPFCIWAQHDERGRLLHLREKMGQDIEIDPFVDEIRRIEAQHFKNHKDFRDYGDPAARQKKDTGQTQKRLLDKGIVLQYKTGRTIDDGLQIMRIEMNKMIDGEPALQYDKNGVPILIAALRGGYHVDDTGKPVKDGYYDHPADTDRYGIDNVTGGSGSASTMLVNMPLSLEYRADQDAQLQAGGSFNDEYIQALNRALGNK